MRAIASPAGVNGGGDRRAEFNEGGGLKERVVLLFTGSSVAGKRTWPRSAATLAAGEKKRRQDAAGGVGEGLADVRHPSRTEHTKKRCEV
ncbi:MAG TPA: hypothetical protein VJP78_09850 [Thermoleophilia bacterium]|nr:hypothetical protein [Thermoleophilia bacterium]